MRSTDVIQLYNVVGPGARVSIINGPLAAMVPMLTAPARALAQVEAGSAAGSGAITAP
jgi:hypothetical protein